ncbi:MAG: SCO family protein [Anaerolineales bacterium]
MTASQKFIIAAVALLAGVAAVYFGGQMVARSQAFRGSLIEPSLAAADFSLAQTNGEDYTLADQRGRVVLVFFGYTNCPDVCPLTLAEYRQIYNQLGEQADHVDFVFVTVDPQRDTPEVIDEFVHAFNPDFIGLTGTDEQLQAAWDAYWVGRQVPFIEDSDDGHEEGEAHSDGYEVSHSTRIYVIDKLGNLRLTFPFGMSALDMAHDVSRLLSE